MDAVSRTVTASLPVSGQTIQESQLRKISAKLTRLDATLKQKASFSVAQQGDVAPSSVIATNEPARHPEDPKLRRISRKLTQLDQRVQQEMSGLYSRLAEPSATLPDAQLRKLTRKLTQLDQSVKDELSGVNNRLSSLGLGKDPQLRKISRKLTQLDQRVSRDLSSIFARMKENMEQLQTSSLVGLESIRANVKKLSKAQSKTVKWQDLTCQSSVNVRRH